MPALPPTLAGSSLPRERITVIPGLAHWRELGGTLALPGTVLRLRRLARDAHVFYSETLSTLPFCLLAGGLLGIRSVVHVYSSYGSPRPYRKHWLGRARHVVAPSADSLRLASELLSASTHQLGFAVLPRLDRVALRHASLIRISSERVLVVLVSRSGVTYQRVIRDARSGDQARLERIEAELNRRLAGQNLVALRARLEREAEQLRDRAERLLLDTLVLAVRALSERYGEVINVYKAVGGGWVDLADPLAPQPAPIPPAEAAAAAAPAPSGASANSQDRTAVVQEGNASVLDVYRERGIGGVEMRAPGSGWPSAVKVRFHGFPGLESFTAKTATSSLLCATQRREGRPAEEVCTLNGARVDAIRRSDDRYEVSLPAGMLTPATSAIEVRWVDQWR